MGFGVGLSNKHFQPVDHWIWINARWWPLPGHSLQSTAQWFSCTACHVKIPESVLFLATWGRTTSCKQKIMTYYHLIKVAVHLTCHLHMEHIQSIVIHTWVFTSVFSLHQILRKTSGSLDAKCSATFTSWLLTLLPVVWCWAGNEQRVNQSFVAENCCWWNKG